MPTAARALAHAACPVFIHTLGVAHAYVTHVLEATILTDFQVSVSMHFGDMRTRDSTFTVEAIDVLTDDVLKMVLLHQLKEGHMSWRRVCLQNSTSQRSLVMSFLRSLLSGLLRGSGICSSWFLLL